jgi:membrane protein YdbS with pleckstrin-like domain
MQNQEALKFRRFLKVLLLLAFMLLTVTIMVATYLQKGTVHFDLWPAAIIWSSAVFVGMYFVFSPSISEERELN